MATIGLRQLVAQFLDSADQSSHQFRRMYNIGVRGSRAFNLDITGQMITVLLPVNVNNTVNTIFERKNPINNVNRTTKKGLT